MKLKTVIREAGRILDRIFFMIGIMATGGYCDARWPDEFEVVWGIVITTSFAGFAWLCFLRPFLEGLRGDSTSPAPPSP